MGFFDSSNAQEEEVFASETGQQVQDSALAFNVSGKGDLGAFGKKSHNNTLTIATTDHGSVAAGLEAVDKSFSFAGGAFTKAVESIDSANDQAFSFAGGAATKAAETTDNALVFAGGAFTSSLDAIEASAARSSAAYSAAIASNDANNKRNLESLERTTDKAFDFVGGAFTTAFDGITDQGATTLSAIQASSSESIAAVSSATRSDAADSFNKLLDMSGKAVIALAVVMLVMFFIFKKVK